MKRVLSIIVLLIGACMLVYSIYMVGIGKSLAEPAGIVFTVIGLLILSLGAFFNVRLSRPKKQTLKLACMLMGHKWKEDYRNVNDPLWGKTHTCSRCGIMQEHFWERIENRCQEQCTKCGSWQSVKHSFVEKSPCHFVCGICGEQEERHSFVKKSDCEKVCSNCSKVEVTHKWNTVYTNVYRRGSIHINGKSVPTGGYEEVANDGCFCEHCLEINPSGMHEYKSDWEDAFYVTKCKHCGTICEKLTEEEKRKKDMEEDRRRYEQAVNEDEGIFR